MKCHVDSHIGPTRVALPASISILKFLLDYGLFFCLPRYSFFPRKSCKLHSKLDYEKGNNKEKDA